MHMSVEPVYSRCCTEIKVAEKLIDFGWPNEQSNRRRPYHGKLFRTKHDPIHKYKRIREEPWTWNVCSSDISSA